MTGLRTVLAAGSALRRAAMVRLLHDAGFVVAGQGLDAGDDLAHRPDVAIAELAGLGDCVPTLRTIRSELPDVGVLLISPRVDARHAAALVELRAEGGGYLLEARVTGVARFIEAVRHVADRGTIHDPEVVTRLVVGERHDPFIDALSDRDREVLAQVAAGVNDRGIARRMFLSERAIERHVTSIFDTLGITAAGEANRRVLAALAYRNAWSATRAR